MNIFFYTVPHFLNRYYLYRDIRAAVDGIQPHGDVLDIGCGDKPYRSLFTTAKSYTGIDFEDFSGSKGYGRPGKPDVFFPAGYTVTHKLPFARTSFDHAVSFQVLEHHPQPDILISEMARILKPGGTFILSAPFIWSLHEEPHDFSRFTHYKLMHMANEHGLTVRYIWKQGSICSLITTLLIDYCIELAARNAVLYILTMFIYPLLLIASYLCLILDRMFPSDTLFFNYVISGYKRV